jgi:hypothetical protein
MCDILDNLTQKDNVEVGETNAKCVPKKRACVFDEKCGT